MHIWEELLDSICAIVFQKLHQLSLIDNVEEAIFIRACNLLWHFDDYFLGSCDDLIERT